MSGLAPSVAAAPPTADALAQTGNADEAPAEASLIGFRQLGPGRTLIYVDLSSAVEPTLTGHGRTLEYTFPETRAPLRNNRRPLLSRHFDSVVYSAQLVPKGQDLTLVIQLREAAAPEGQLLRHALGATFEVELARAPR